MQGPQMVFTEVIILSVLLQKLVKYDSHKFVYMHLSIIDCGHCNQLCYASLHHISLAYTVLLVCSLFLDKSRNLMVVGVFEQQPQIF